eukprot:s2305_g2.t1
MGTWQGLSLAMDPEESLQPADGVGSALPQNFSTPEDRDPPSTRNSWQFTKRTKSSKEHEAIFKLAAKTPLIGPFLAQANGGPGSIPMSPGISTTPGCPSFDQFQCVDWGKKHVLTQPTLRAEWDAISI